MPRITQLPEPLLVSADEVANMLGISRRTLWRMRSSGKLIKPIHVGGSVRWRLEELRTWIAEGCPQQSKGTS